MVRKSCILTSFTGYVAYCPIIHKGQKWRNRGQNRGNFFPEIEGILKGNREQNLFVYVQRFKGPAIPKHRLPSKYTIVETPSGTRVWFLQETMKFFLDENHLQGKKVKFFLW